MGECSSKEIAVENRRIARKSCKHKINQKTRIIHRHRISRRILMLLGKVLRYPNRDNFRTRKLTNILVFYRIIMVKKMLKIYA